MCGICGFIRFDRLVGGEDALTIERMNRKLVHRGPDAQDTLMFDNLALGFSRLSIIGLENGMQPITNEDESVVVICNGEIFNYIELRRELLEKGHKFKTGSDVEVLVHMYEDFGIDFIDKLNGQFAFVIYDKNRRKLFCARDQMGIVPFFYTRKDNVFIFGSEIKAILEHPEATRTVDRVGLDQIMTFAGLVSPRTMFKDIYSLENGHYLLVNEQGDIADKEYWDLIYPKFNSDQDGLQEEDYVDQLEQLFEDSIRLRLRADVPTGLYLSGGLDSSMIAMKVSQLTPGITQDAFSIDFVQSDLSESFYQRLVASEARVNHHQKIFLYNDISERLRQSVYHSECPIKETYNTASLSLSETVRSKGIKVILSGEGADELFAGYVGYRFDKMKELGFSKAQVDPAEEELRDRIWGDASFYYEKNFVDHNKTKKKIYSPEMEATFGEFDCLNHPLVKRERIAGRNELEKRAYIDYKIRLVDHLLSDHGDRMALANSVEVRYPFLDKNLVEFSRLVPSGLKLKGFKEKYILKKLATRFVPRAVYDREKFHFVAPGSPFLLQNKVEYINDLLSNDTIRRQGYFDPNEVERLKLIYSKEGYTVNAPYEDDLLIIVITFGILLDTFFR